VAAHVRTVKTASGGTAAARYPGTLQAWSRVSQVCPWTAKARKSVGMTVATVPQNRPLNLSWANLVRT
jgi:hypothetical protein